MIVTGVVAEFNPFHNGHEYILRKARELTGADVILVIMSGDFVQRGGAACLPSSVRCDMALSCGADVVLELPSYANCKGANVFAESSVSILDRLGCVNHLCFGCEDPDLILFDDLADILINEPESYKQLLRDNLKEGKSFALSRGQALAEYYDRRDVSAFLRSPNNILALEYIIALKKLGSSIRPLPVSRIGSAYHDFELSDAAYPSASAIRRLLEDDNDHSPSEYPGIPGPAAQILKKFLSEHRIIKDSDFSEMMGYALTLNRSNLTAFCDITDAAANRIDMHMHEYTDFNSFVSIINSRNITETRVRRILFNVLLDHRESVFRSWKKNGYTGFVNVLGFRREKAGFFHAAAKTSVADDNTGIMDSLIIRPLRDIPQAPLQEIYENELLSKRIYNLLIQPAADPERSGFATQII